MELCDLFPTPGSRKKRKRIGRGIAAGQGKTAGRGHKGDKARGQSKIGFEGGQTPLHRRLPRHRGFTNMFRRHFAEVNVEKLESFEKGSEITPDVLLETGIIRKLRDGVKVLGNGELSVKLTVKAHAFTGGALAKIVAAGGQAFLIKHDGSLEEVKPDEAAEPAPSEKTEDKAEESGE